MMYRITVVSRWRLGPRPVDGAPVRRYGNYFNDDQL